VEFLRRFLLHILPTGFVRIRYFGLVANRCRAQNLERCRALIEPEPCATPGSTPEITAMPKTADEERARCPSCGVGRLHNVGLLAPAAMPELDAWAPRGWDTS
jgi:hypothetical protein